MRRLTLLLLAGTGLGQGSPAASPADDAAERVLAAVRAEDERALAQLASQDIPDPWAVADELCVRGEHDAAHAFASASPRKDVEGLPAYVASRRGQDPGLPPRAAYRASIAAWRAGELAKALDLLPEPGGPGGELFSARVEFFRGRLLFESGRHEESATTFSRCAETALAIRWFAHAADAFGKTGYALAQIGRFADARRFYEQELDLLEGREDRAALAECLGNLGAVHQALGDHEASAGFLDRAVLLRKEIGDDARTSAALRSLAIARNEMGEQRRAAESIEIALAIDRRLGEQAAVAADLGVLGAVRLREGDFARALRLQEESLALAEKLGDEESIASALGDLSNVHGRIGNHEEALRCNERSYSLLRRTGNKSLLAVSLYGLGACHLVLDARDKALARFEEALNLSMEIGDRPGIAKCHEAIGRVLILQGAPEKALVRIEEALAISRALSAPAGVAETLDILGHVYLLLKQPDRSFEVRREAVAIAEASGSRPLLVHCREGLLATLVSRRAYEEAIRVAHATIEDMRWLARGLGDEEGAKTRERRVGVFEAGAAAAFELGRDEDLWYFLEAGRAAGLREELSWGQDLRSVLLPVELRDEEARARAAENRAASRCQGVSDVAETRRRRAELDDARLSLARVAARIERERKDVAEVLYLRPAPLAEVQAALREGEALVLYFHVSPVAFALRVTRAAVCRIELGPSSEIESACAALGSVDPGSDPAPALERLRRMVADPVVSGAGISRVLVSPYGFLSFVPFALLFPDKEVAHVPSGTTLSLLRAAKDEAGDGVLALGDPDYRSQDDPSGALRALRGADRLARLPGTRAEAMAVGDRLLLGAEATKSNLARSLQERRRWRSVHLACHGIANAATPAFSSLALTPEGDDPGFLTALDVARLRVPAQLVVLSACATGRGRVYKAEGIVGLTRAFMVAGAPRVIVSLWKVDDEATKALMVKFYELWTAGKPVAGALREAQRAIAAQEKWRHPHYWAAWQLWGLPN